jgi:hypothetical protein
VLSGGNSGSRTSHADADSSAYQQLLVNDPIHADFDKTNKKSQKSQKHYEMEWECFLASISDRPSKGQQSLFEVISHATEAFKTFAREESAPGTSLRA